MPRKTLSDASSDAPKNLPGKPEKTLDYKAAGVDVAAGNAFVESIKPLCAKTLRPEVIAGAGGFAGLFKLNKYRKPVLAAATDGVGTKLKLAQTLGVHRGVGIDLVAMCVNDVLTHGAEPLFFLDYLACGKLAAIPAQEIVSGVAAGCELAGCALIGGETAEMPGMYAEDEYDLAGFTVGAAEQDALCGAHRVRDGDAVVALASSGVHANGFSLIRRIIAESGADLDHRFGDATLGETLLEPTRIYVKTLLSAVSRGDVRAMAHVTGGGLDENLPRMIGTEQSVVVALSSWTPPPIFEWIRTAGNVEQREMQRVFNCGVGMAAVVAPDAADALVREVETTGLDAWVLGEIVARGNNPPVVYV